MLLKDNKCLSEGFTTVSLAAKKVVVPNYILKMLTSVQQCNGAVISVKPAVFNFVINYLRNERFQKSVKVCCMLRCASNVD